MSCICWIGSVIGSSHFSEGSEYDWEGKFDGLDGLEPSMVGGGAGGIAVYRSVDWRNGMEVVDV